MDYLCSRKLRYGDRNTVTPRGPSFWRMARVWGWVKAHPAISAAFLGGLLLGVLIGAPLGWAGVGDGSINWGTAGEWVGGVFTGAAVLVAVLAFLVEGRQVAMERREREMRHALPVALTVHPLEWHEGEANRLSAYKLPVNVRNDGTATISNINGVGKDSWQNSWRTHRPPSTAAIREEGN
jgi:hypothetical protein